MIRIVYDLTTKELVAITNAADGITAFHENTFGILQGTPKEIITQALSFDIDTTGIFTFLTQNNIVIPMATELQMVLKDRNFCKSIQLKLLATQKLTGILDPLVYREMNKLFRDAKDAADNGSPSQVKYELQQLSDALPLPNWATIKQELITEIDNYILQNP